MTGGPGNDYMDGQGAGATFNGVDYLTAPGPVNATLAGIQVTITADGTDTVRNTLRVRGSNFDDTIAGFFVIFGEGGADTLTGDDNTNTLDGGSGADTLNGLGGADYLRPGPGAFNDVVNGGTTAGNANNGGNRDTLDLSDATGPVSVTNGRTTGTATGQGTDTLNSIEVVTGGGFDDTFLNDDGLCLDYNGGAGNDTFTMVGDEFCMNSIAPGPGNDTVGGDPNAPFTLGAGIELVYTNAAGPVNVNLMTGVATGEGTDTISAILGVRGSKFNDVINGDDHRNQDLFGDAGDDEIHGNGNVDTILGGPGNDILDGGNTPGVEYSGDPGGDYDVVDYVEETFGDPRYASAAAVNVNLITNIATGDGTDTLLNFEGVEGSAFGDTLTLPNIPASSAYGSSGNDTINGGSGADSINGGSGLDTILGNGGNDTIAGGGCFGPCGGSAGDTIDGGAGNDQIEPSAGNDAITGGADIDTIVFNVPGNGGPPAGVTVNLLTGSMTGHGTDTINTVENAKGTQFGDTLIGDNGPNVLQGWSFTAVTGDDAINGNGGDDMIIPGDGNDTIDGGAAFDAVDYRGLSNGGITANLCAHTVTGWGSDSVEGIERVNGTYANDTIIGCTGNEYLYGFAGDDALTSGGGTDTLDGFQGTDTCNGDGDETYISCEVIPNGCAGDLECDGVPNATDNCPTTTNADQKNTDAEPLITPGAPDDTSLANTDPYGDACDNDDDNDGLADDYEIVGCSGHPATDPLKADSDGDRVIDGAECFLGSDPANAASKPTAPAPGTDDDGDGLSNAFETNIGSNPNATDSDADGILDGIEYKGYGTSLTAMDTDGDGCADGREVPSVDGSSTVNSLDLKLVATRFQQTDKPVHDVNKDGNINSIDLQMVARNFNPTACT